MQLRSYVDRLHLVGIATLIVLTTGLALLGWTLRPSATGYPTVTPSLEMWVGTAGYRSVTESLTHTGTTSATLTVLGSTVAAGEVPGDKHWTLIVNNLGSGRLCTPDTLVLDQGGSHAFLEPRQHVATKNVPFGTTTPDPYGYHVIAIDGSGPFYVKLCWSSDAPVQISGAYLTAQLPPLAQFYDGKPFSLTRQLNLGEDDAADYSIQSLVLPTSVTSGGWQWTGKPPQYDTLAVSALNGTETQHDTYSAFLSGIVFGIAGGAFVALIQELVAPFRTRRELRPPEPGG
jgi:hypothetical protein